jgi:HK97 family phage major capsid protein
VTIAAADVTELATLTHRLRELVDLGEADLAERKETFDKLNGRLDAVEVKLGRPTIGGQTQSDGATVATLRRAAFDQWARKGAGDMPSGLKQHLVAAEQLDERGNVVGPRANQGSVAAQLANILPPDQVKALFAGDDTLGGYFVIPEIVQDELIKAVVQWSPIRAYARVRPTANQSVRVPVRTSPTAASWTSETGTRAQSANPVFGMKDLPTHEMYAFILISRQLLEDSFFDLEAELVSEYSEQFAVAEAKAFISGDGIGKPFGFLTDTNVTATQSQNNGGSTVLLPDGIINFVHALKSPYVANATMLLNRTTLGAVRTLKDSQNRYLWEPNYQAGLPPTIQGIAYAEAVDMPAVAAAAYPIAIADWKRAYTIVDRTQVAMQRLNELYAQSAQVGFLAWKRVGGQCVLPDAIQLLKMA